jgi:hypothetical protein
MTIQPKRTKRSAKEVIPSLLIGSLGTVGVVALYILVPGFQFFELVLMLMVIGLLAISCRQGIIRGIMTIVILYIATGIAATFYRHFGPFLGKLLQVLAKLIVAFVPIPQLTTTFDGRVDHTVLAISFLLITVLIAIVLEIISRFSFRDTRLPSLGIVDTLGGAVVLLLVGLLITSLLFNTLGYGWMRRTHQKARLRPVFNQVIYLHYVTQSFWFPAEPPPIYSYDVDLTRGR